MHRNRADESLLGSALKAARKAAGLNQSELAAQAGVGERTVYQAEIGGGRLASYIAMTAALNLDIAGRGLPPGQHIGARLATLRQRQGRSVRALADIADVTAATIAAAEGGAPGVRLAAVEAMARAMGVALRLRPAGEAEEFWNGAAVSATHEGWTSPEELLERLYPVVGGMFDLDPCSPARGRAAPVKARNHYTVDHDGLVLAWSGSVYMNPPFRAAADWVAKAKSEAVSGRVSALIGLLPARVDTAWWHDHVARVADVWFLKGRLKFGGSENSAPFPCAIVAWPANDDICQELSDALPTAWHVPRGG